MTTSYPGPVLVVNEPALITAPDWSALPRSVVSFYRWLHRWHSETGDVSPSTGYLAMKQRRTERTVYRWLSRLECAGLVTREVVQGVERRIIPQVEPPPPPRKAPTNRHPGARYRASDVSKMSGGGQGDLSGVPLSHARTQGATTLPTVPPPGPRPAPEAPEEQVAPGGAESVALLVAEGVPVPVARVLVATHGPEVVQEQAEALPFRRPNDRAAVLVASVKGRWSLPAALVAAKERRAKEQRDRSERAARAALAEKRAEQRRNIQTAFSGLPAALQEQYRERARLALAAEQPAAYRLMQGRGMFGSWVEQRARGIAAQGGIG